MGAAGTNISCERWHAASGLPAVRASQDITEFLRRMERAFKPDRWARRRHDAVVAFTAFIRRSYRILEHDPEAFVELALTPAPEA